MQKKCIDAALRLFEQVEIWQKWDKIPEWRNPYEDNDEIIGAIHIILSTQLDIAFDLLDVPDETGYRKRLMYEFSKACDQAHDEKGATTFLEYLMGSVLED